MMLLRSCFPDKFVEYKAVICDYDLHYGIMTEMQHEIDEFHEFNFEIIQGSEIVYVFGARRLVRIEKSNIKSAFYGLSENKSNWSELKERKFRE